MVQEITHLAVVLEVGSLVAKTANNVDLKGGLLRNRACVLSQPVVEPYFPFEYNTHCANGQNLETMRNWQFRAIFWFCWSLKL